MKKQLLILAAIVASFSSMRAQCVPSCSAYVVAPTTPTLISPIGHNTVTTFSSNDDGLSGSLPIGFTFQFYCNNYTSFDVSTNGFISFNINSTSGCCSGQSIPSTGIPNNYIALRWTDLNLYSTGKVTYTTVGIAPNRRCIVTYTDVAIYGSPSLLNSGHIILFETTNEIEIHSISMASSGNICTQGIENSTGTSGVASPGANGTTFAFNNTAYRFFAGGVPNPVTAISGPTTLCQGVSGNFTATSMPGASSYTWSIPGGWSGTSTTSVLQSTTGFSGLVSVAATYSCGTSTPTSLSVTTIPAPSISSLSVTPNLICSGESVTVNGSSGTAVNYTLMPSGLSGNPPFIDVPAASTSYILLAENAAGCVSFYSPTVSVNVKQTPTVSISSGSVCLGQSFALNPQGAAQYTLSGIFSSVTPPTAGTHTYSAVGTNSTGCYSQMATGTVVAMPLPAVTAIATNPTICFKESTSVVAGGATSYVWNTGATTESLNITPQGPVIYTVVGTSNGCSNTATVLVQVVFCTGIEDNGNVTQQIMVYPNPSGGEFMLNASVPVEAIIYDMVGRTVYQKNLSEGAHKINISHLAAGKYLLQTSSGGTKQSSVLIKQ